MNLEPFYQKYGKEKVDAALDLLNYKHVDPMPKTESDTLPTLYIFRHGQTEDNAAYLFSGWRDPELTEKGREQALALAPKLKDKKIDMLISSTQKRSFETMELAISMNDRAKNLEIHKDARIRERSYGELQGESKLEMQLENPVLLAEYRRSYDKRAAGGENMDDVVKRVASFCDEIIPLMKEHKINVAISCHGNSIRGFRAYFEHLPHDVLSEMETPLGQDYLAYVIK